MLARLKDSFSEFANGSSVKTGATTLALATLLTFSSAASNTAHAEEVATANEGTIQTVDYQPPATVLSTAVTSQEIAVSETLQRAKASVKDGNDIGIAILKGDDMSFTGSEYGEKLRAYILNKQDPNFPVDIAFTYTNRTDGGQTAVNFYTLKRAYGTYDAIEAVEEAEFVLNDMRLLTSYAYVEAPSADND